jgi:5'-nucleotidase/UDP-sugar diphosphatase
MKKIFSILPFFLVFIPCALYAAYKQFTFIHTNDLHSHLLGSAPSIDYSPGSTGDDATLGGWARISTVIKRTEAERRNPVMVVDAGDFLMGSLFHMLSRERSFELVLMKYMGYDVLTLGNHEFDLKPAGLARIIESARISGGPPYIVASNLVFSTTSDKDDSLEADYKSGHLLPYTVLTRNGTRIGFFGLMGKGAGEVSPFAKPVTFGDPVRSAREMIALLRNREKVDMVVCLSHGGVYLDDIDASEDVILARKAPGIDIIFSGHTHTPLRSPLQVGNTIIVQAWCYGRWAGILDVTLGPGGVKMKGYRPVLIDDSIPGDPRVMERIQDFKKKINASVLAPFGYSFDSIVAHTDFDLKKGMEASNLGDLIADASRWYANKIAYDPRDPGSRIAVSLDSNGIIRDNVMKGKTGRIAVCDLFAALPLGIGSDDSMGYPMVAMYLYASEIKKALEVVTSIYPQKGNRYFLHVSGLKATYNPNRVIFDRVTGISIGDDETGYKPVDYSSSNKKLYRVATNLYNAAFIKIVGDFTMNVLKIVPKNRRGRPIEDIAKARIDADPHAPGIQEAKQWAGLVEYVRSFSDINGDGVPDVPLKYRDVQGRIVRLASWNPVSLIKKGNFVTWAGFTGVIFMSGIVGAVGTFVIMKIIKKRRRA